MLRNNRYTVTLAAVIGILFLGGIIAGCDNLEDQFWYDLFIGDYYSAACDLVDLIESSSVPGQLASMTFEANLGQTDARYPYLARGKQHSILLSAAEMTFELPDKASGSRMIHAHLEGANSGAQSRAMEPQTGRVNYLIGNDPNKWVKDIPTFARIAFANVYPGVDVQYHGAGGFVEYDFIVAPGADPRVIRMNFAGADAVRVVPGGSLSVASGKRTLQWKKPVIYQENDQGVRTAVEGRYKVEAQGAVGFELGVYDLKRPLVIDPVVTYATYFGTANTDGAARVAADAGGNAYIIGGTNASSFPVTPGTAYNPGTSLTGDVLLAKVAADGKTMVFTTHLGGGTTDTGFGIALDSSGNIYLTGLTFSDDFPHTANLTPNTILPASVCFVTKLNSTGNTIVYSTLIGGSKGDGCSAVGVDATGSAVVVGGTGSPDFPTVNAVQKTLKTSGASQYNADAFIAKLSPDGSKLTYSTYFGGLSPDFATAVAVDAAGNAYVTGYTLSPDFPVSSGAFQTTYGGGGGQFSSIVDTGDAFVVKMTPTGTVSYATFLGGKQDDVAAGIAIDSQGNAYVAGATLSKDFPLQQAFQTAYKGAGGDTRLNGGDGFIAELNASGSSLLFSSYLGGSLDDRAAGVAVDSSGNIWVAGHTMSNDFPVTADAPQAKNAGDDGSGSNLLRLGDAFLVEIGTSRKIAFGTYLGGTSTDWAGGVALDGQGGVVIAGGTTSKDFPSSAGVYQAKYAGADLGIPSGDAFIARYGGSTSSVSVAGVSNAASFASGAVAPGEAILIAGTNIGPATLAGAQLASNGRLATQVAGAQFLFDGVPAPIVYVSSGYSSVIVPYAVAGKSSTQLTATYNGANSPPITLQVAPAAPGIFSANVSGHGQAAAYNGDLTTNSAQNPAARGTQVVLFVTGEGQTSPPGVDGQITAAVIAPAQSVSVSFGGVPATNYAFIGEVPAVTAGVLQINVTVPATAPTGDVPVVVTVGNTPSQTALTIAIR
jgi:uncharacterized protein (TIGR03437 family)